MIDNVVAYSNSGDNLIATREVMDKIDAKGKPKLVLFFVAGDELEPYTKAFFKAYPDSITVGVTSYTAYSSEGYSSEGLVAVAIYDGVECAADVLLDAPRYPIRYADRIESALSSLSGFDNTVCVEYTTAEGFSEELVQDTYRSVLEPRNIPLAGGSAGRTVFGEQTRVSLNGFVHNEASVFILIRNLSGRIFLYKENIFVPTSTVLTATDVDCDTRVVYEYDDMPAAEAMSMVLNVNKDELEDIIIDNPVGRVKGDDVNIIVANRIERDGSIHYAARIYNRSKLAILKIGDIEDIWNKTAANVNYELESPSLSLFVDCSIRIQLYERRNMLGKYMDKLRTEYGSFIGASGYGEQINFENFNETMVMVIFE